MLFSSPVFIFGFLPLMIAGYYLSPRVMRNIFLLLGSLVFYAWGEDFYILIMIASILSNYFFGLLIAGPSTIQFRKRLFLFLGMAVNICLLGTFKYANFLVDNCNSLLEMFHLKPILLEPVHLPMGISFFTFQAISYLVDVYREEAPAQKNVLNLSLYISLFPKLFAGPIVRYKDIAGQIARRENSLSMVSEGIQRFIFGLAKKMLIANTLGEVADSIFSLPVNEISSPVSWLGSICYTLQIYFDFSGYSDMAIGLGLMFGFRFRENFNYPYISKSIKEFWRRWHISLSSWFRDYLYIPLGGSRISPMRTYCNLFIVFLLCGLWHGASWNFIIWGLIHGFFIVIERMGADRVLKRLWPIMGHAYAILVVLFAWVFFRADTLSGAMKYISAMLGLNSPSGAYMNLRQFLTHEAGIALVLGIILSTPVFSSLVASIKALVPREENGETLVYFVPKMLLMGSLLFLSILKISASTYNPFIYFRF